MVFLGSKLQENRKKEENQKKTKRKPKENRRKPKKTRRKENHRPSAERDAPQVKILGEGEGVLNLAGATAVPKQPCDTPPATLCFDAALVRLSSL